MNDLPSKMGSAAADMVAAGVVVATVLDYLPPIAAALTIIYTALRIYESDTVRGWLGHKRSNLPPKD